jgi:hypothetical protein
MLLRVVVVLVLIGVTVYALVDCLRTDGPDLRLLPKPVWLLLIVLLPIAGSVLYLAVGRATDDTPAPVARPLAPDDDPDFLRRLDVERRRLVAEEERRRRRSRGTGTPGDGPADGTGGAQGNGQGEGGPDGDDHTGHPA